MCDPPNPKFHAAKREGTDVQPVRRHSADITVTGPDRGDIIVQGVATEMRGEGIRSTTGHYLGVKS